MNYYNDNEAKCCAWLAELTDAGLIPTGEIDDRSIHSLDAEDLSEFDQCHFFAGIGGWVYALDLAGWPPDAPVWTGSCPCQPFSFAGKRKGHEDERHLWPVWFDLIRECHPPVIFGEQVASRLGREWLAGVRTDLEAVGYAVGAADLCAAGVGAPHIRQRLYWVGISVQQRLEGHSGNGKNGNQPGWLGKNKVGSVAETGDADRLADAGNRTRRSNQSQRGQKGRTTDRRFNPWIDSIAWPCADRKWRRIPARPYQFPRGGGTDIETDEERKILFPESSLFPLATGVPGRVGLLRGAGNAIVPQVAAVFIRAVMDYLGFELQ